jgi:hypothetical protein
MSKHDRKGPFRRPWQAPSPDALAGNEAYQKALEVLSQMRQGWSLTQASLRVGTTPRVVQRYVGSALERDDEGRWQPKDNDRLYRRMRFLDDKGAVTVEPADAQEAGKLGAYWRAVHLYLSEGDTSELSRFRWERLRTRQGQALPFLTDRHQLARLRYAGELSFEDLYQH